MKDAARQVDVKKKKKGYKHAMGSQCWKILPDGSMMFLTDAEEKYFRLASGQLDLDASLRGTPG